MLLHFDASDAFRPVGRSEIGQVIVRHLRFHRLLRTKGRIQFVLVHWISSHQSYPQVPPSVRLVTYGVCYQVIFGS